MGLKIGCGWTKNTQDNQTYMSFSLYKEILEMYPQLKNLRLNAFHIPQSERKNENSPGWSLVLSAPTDNKKELTEEEIPI